ncbi:hypothetical protein RIF29_38055 [Crotalaria pallida]|uniref:Uncharacterized protein n=1 Tax=Crotalaria pallida TaxID=3830 RepID=A0AAN9E1I0_CROPI
MCVAVLLPSARQIMRREMILVVDVIKSRKLFCIASVIVIMFGLFGRSWLTVLFGTGFLVAQWGSGAIRIFRMGLLDTCIVLGRLSPSRKPTSDEWNDKAPAIVPIIDPLVPKDESLFSSKPASVSRNLLEPSNQFEQASSLLFHNLPLRRNASKHVYTLFSLPA